MRQIALVLEYEGTSYSGFQRQANANSVQAVLEEALERMTTAFTRTSGSGRTDAGVHAMGQVVSFKTNALHSTQSFCKGLNHYLPKDISVVSAHEVPVSFDPRRHATSRIYRYTILNAGSRSSTRHRFVHVEGRPLDLPAMQRALTHLEGDRNFAPFSGQLDEGKSTVRCIYRTVIWRENDEVRIEIEGSAFLPQQVRRIAGTILQVGLGRLSLDRFFLLADLGKQGEAHWVLPPNGLCLRQVKYQEFPTRSHARTKDDHTHTAGPVDTEMACH